MYDDYHTTDYHHYRSRTRHNSYTFSAIAGIMKLLFPKRSRQASEHMTPIKAGRCRLAVSHWSRNITKKRAVITNSIPVVSK